MSTCRIGVTSSWSKVPASRSRATERPTTSKVTTWVSSATMPGTMNQCESSARVVPRTHVEHRRRRGRRRGPHPVKAEIGDDRVGVAADQERGVGVAAIDDQLHRRRLVPQQIAGETADGSPAPSPPGGNRSAGRCGARYLARPIRLKVGDPQTAPPGRARRRCRPRRRRRSARCSDRRSRRSRRR